MTFLKTSDLVNGSINFRYLGHIGPETKKKKAGGTYEIYTFQLETTSDSVVHQYDINKQGAEYRSDVGRLIDCQKGDFIQAYINGEWVNWKVLPNESEPSTMQSHASENKSQIEAESSLTNRKIETDFTDKIKQRMISQQGFSQAWIISRGTTLAANSLIDRAIDFGAQAAKANRERAKTDILQEESK